ncbi:heme-binding protein [Pseudorhodoplanes sp.]|uniref:GlcG/HbpS family heme-binding protein n=1 Tax=Pseudorhodoplanes sp. TaxID=1934341 RepID=UPI002B8322ED|nr:heme-binding protein [Pseudorhodoplanes sp.]HWV51832.1 heme-binding protein [Pseudorhodoplanes sp.]
MRFTTIALAFAASLLAAPLSAQTTTPPPYGAPITLEAAKKVVAAAESEAARNNWQVAIAVIDSGGHLVMMMKLDNTQLVSIRVAEAKAKSALGFRLPTKLLEDAVAAGGAGSRLLAVPDIAPFEGGFPIIEDGKIIGAIGVAGVLSSQDAQVAKAGLAALGGATR